MKKVTLRVDLPTVLGPIVAGTEGTLTKKFWRFIHPEGVLFKSFDEAVIKANPTVFEIEEDDPPHHPPEWFEQWGAEEIGECRVPVLGEMFAPLNEDGSASSGISSGPGTAITSAPCFDVFNRRRHIVRKRAPKQERFVRVEVEPCKHEGRWLGYTVPGEGQVSIERALCDRRFTGVAEYRMANGGTLRLAGIGPVMLYKEGSRRCAFSPPWQDELRSGECEIVHPCALWFDMEAGKGEEA